MRVLIVTGVVTDITNSNRVSSRDRLGTKMLPAFIFSSNCVQTLQSNLKTTFLSHFLPRCRIPTTIKSGACNQDRTST